MKKINISDKLFHILTPVLLGTVVGIFFKDYTSYIETLERTIKVPTIIFPIAWTILYILIGFWYDNFEKDNDNKLNKIIYYGLLCFNLLFTPVLFYLKQIVLALIIVAILLVGNIYLFVRSIRNGKYAYLLLPYVLWLCFALVLMLDLFIHNVI